MAEAGWHADPAGTHEHRWWDGAAWTEHVADGGVAAVDPLPGVPASGLALTEALSEARRALDERITAAGSAEHPTIELQTAVAVADGVIQLLAVNPSAAGTFGVGFPDDPDGRRLLAAAELHRPGSAVTVEDAASALRVLAFHVLLVLTEDDGAREACARSLGTDGDRWAVAAEVGEAFRAIADPPDAEWQLLTDLYRTCPGRGWDEAYHARLAAHLRDRLAPGEGSGFDGVQLLWAAIGAILEPYALGLFPGVAASSGG